MTKYKSHAWLVVWGLFVSLLPFIGKEINIGSVEITRNEAIESGIAYLVALLGALLIIGAFTSLRGVSIGSYLCKFWGVIYSVSILVFLFIKYGTPNFMYIGIALLFSVIWYALITKQLKEKNA